MYHDREGGRKLLSFSYLCFIINSSSGEPLNRISNAKCRLFNTATGQKLAGFTLTHDNQLNRTALLVDGGHGDEKVPINTWTCWSATAACSI
jgi:hypothetical protein